MLASAGIASAGGVTAVNTTSPSDGVSVIDILNHTYGGSFGGNLATSLSNGGVVATRISDFTTSALLGGSNPLYLGTGLGDTDQVWHDGTIAFAAQARYAGYQQYFGYRNGTAGGTGVTNGMAVSGSGYGVSGGGSWFVGPTAFQWIRSGNASFTNDAGNGDVYSSIAANNADQTDHMVTYEITGLGNLRYMLFWEDLPSVNGGLPGDYDYNDLAIEIQTITAIPLPSAGAMASVGLLGLGLRRRAADLSPPSAFSECRPATPRGGFFPARFTAAAKAIRQATSRLTAGWA